ncbi:hypothetical protein SynSYN20_00982 [Synechococcus sp. SYN20]|nr:hypothetical protein SynSYN20_00982 [Synechococcus sp. SYN20]
MPLSAWFDAIKLNRFLDQIDDFAFPWAFRPCMAAWMCGPSGPFRC